MGSKPSSLAKKRNEVQQDKSLQPQGKRGQKSPTAVGSSVADPTATSEEVNVIATDEENSDEDSYETAYDEEFDDEDEDEYWNYRQSVMQDLKMLKLYAEHYMHPELPVKVDPVSTARCYFDRASAPEPQNFEYAQERATIMEEMKALKHYATEYLHPELPVATTDPTATARNYFGRASAPEQESAELAEERATILEEMRAMKRYATDYLHPELPVATTDPTATARCYFDRASALEQESMELAVERARILEDCRQLKQAAEVLHPELPVATTDPFACGRNYFGRPSAPGHEEMIHTFLPHEDDLHHDEHHHLDHFGMDEEIEHMFDNMRQELHVPGGPKNKKQAGSEEDEGSLSRSPSSVMLFTGEAIYE